MTFLLLLVLRPLGLLAQCEVLGKFGIYDFESSHVSSEHTLAYRNWMCQSNYKERGSGNHTDASATIPLEDILAVFGFNHDESSYEKAHFEFCTADSKDARFAQVADIVTKRVDPILATALKECVNSEGAKAWVVTTDDPMRFKFHTLLSGSESAVAVHYLSLTAASGRSVVCHPATMTRITGAGQTLGCTRPDSSEVLIVLNASVVIKELTPLDLPAIHGFEQPSPIQIAWEAQNATSGTQNVRLTGSTYGADVVQNWPPNSIQRDELHYRVNTPRAYRWVFSALVAAGDARPCTVTVDSKQVFSSAFGGVTANHDASSAIWMEAGVIALPAGDHEIVIARDAPIPHFRKFRLDPAGPVDAVVSVATTGQLSHHRPMVFSPTRLKALRMHH